MMTTMTPEQEPRAPFSKLRPWEPVRDDEAHTRARTRLDRHIPARTRPQRRLAHPPRRRLILALAALIVVVGAGVAIASGFWRTQHTGHLPIYSPQGALNPRFTVKATVSGHCFTDSAATSATDAYRCMQGSSIWDPCFAASAHATTVACFVDPWQPVTILRLTKPLPTRGHTTGASLPWAIETTDGRHCTYFTGATGPMGGERVNYGCTDRSVLIGSPDTRRPLWTIHSAATYKPDVPGHPRAITDFPLAKIARTIP
jgi:hypothetical protein